jgi:hypothetical protein
MIYIRIRFHQTYWYRLWPLEAYDCTLWRLGLKWRCGNSVTFFCPIWGLLRQTLAGPEIARYRLHLSRDDMLSLPACQSNRILIQLLISKHVRIFSKWFISSYDFMCNLIQCPQKVMRRMRGNIARRGGLWCMRHILLGKQWSMHWVCNSGGRNKKRCKILILNLFESSHLEDREVNARTGLRWKLWGWFSIVCDYWFWY